MKAATLAKTMPGLTLARAKSEIDECNEALRLAHCTTVNRVAMFLSQIAVESMNLRYTQEIASGAAYNGRRDLGNTQAGDGPRFKGRSYIQVTGRTHYRNLSVWAHGKGLVPNSNYFIDNPAMLASKKYRWIGPVWYFTTQRPMNKHADNGNIRAGTIAVNGGTNGLAARTRVWNTVRQLGKAVLPAPPPTVTASKKNLKKAQKDGGLLDMATYKTFKTNKKPKNLPRNKWRAVRFGNKAQYLSLLVCNGNPVYVESYITLAGLGPDDSVQARYYNVSFKKGTKTKITGHYPVEERRGSTGHTFIHVSQLGKASALKKRSRRMRLRLKVTGPGKNKVRIVKTQAKLLKG